MAAQIVPAHVAIRRNRVANIDVDRLIRRRDYLIDVLILNGGRNLPGGRMNYGHRAAELHVIRQHLIARGAVSPAADAAVMNAAQDAAAMA